VVVGGQRSQRQCQQHMMHGSSAMTCSSRSTAAAAADYAAQLCAASTQLLLPPLVHTTQQVYPGPTPQGHFMHAPLPLRAYLCILLGVDDLLLQLEVLPVHCLRQADVLVLLVLALEQVVCDAAGQGRAGQSAAVSATQMAQSQQHDSCGSYSAAEVHSGSSRGDLLACPAWPAPGAGCEWRRCAGAYCNGSSWPSRAASHWQRAMRTAHQYLSVRGS
jgi:hypothetical protein